jgi:hypothetical protein
MARAPPLWPIDVDSREGTKMSFTSTQVTQNGNTTVTWTLGPHPVLSDRDVIVLKPETGTSRMRIDSQSVGLPPNYSVTVSVLGAGAMAFRFSGQQID